MSKTWMSPTLMTDEQREIAEQVDEIFKRRPNWTLIWLIVADLAILAVVAISIAAALRHA